MHPTCAEFGIRLLMDSTVSLQETEDRVFAALRMVLAVLDATSPDGVI
jgi:hypothetical protein